MHDLISGPEFVATNGARAEPLLLFATNASDEVCNNLRLIDWDDNIVRVIKRPCVWTSGYHLNGPICIVHDYVGIDSIINAIDLSTGL